MTSYLSRPSVHSPPPPPYSRHSTSSSSSQQHHSFRSHKRHLSSFEKSLSFNSTNRRDLLYPSRIPRLVSLPLKKSCPSTPSSFHSLSRGSPTYTPSPVPYPIDAKLLPQHHHNLNSNINSYHNYHNSRPHSSLRRPVSPSFSDMDTSIYTTTSTTTTVVESTNLDHQVDFDDNHHHHHHMFSPKSTCSSLSFWQDLSRSAQATMAKIERQQQLEDLMELSSLNMNKNTLYNLEGNFIDPDHQQSYNNNNNNNNNSNNSSNSNGLYNHHHQQQQPYAWSEQEGTVFGNDDDLEAIESITETDIVVVVAVDQGESYHETQNMDYFEEQQDQQGEEEREEEESYDACNDHYHLNTNNYNNNRDNIVFVINNEQQHQQQQYHHHQQQQSMWSTYSDQYFMEENSLTLERLRTEVDWKEKEEEEEEEEEEDYSLWHENESVRVEDLIGLDDDDEEDEENIDDGYDLQMRAQWDVYEQQQLHLKKQQQDDDDDDVDDMEQDPERNPLLYLDILYGHHKVDQLFAEIQRRQKTTKLHLSAIDKRGRTFGIPVPNHVLYHHLNRGDDDNDGEEGQEDQQQKRTTFSHFVLGKVDEMFGGVEKKKNPTERVAFGMVDMDTNEAWIYIIL